MQKSTPEQKSIELFGFCGFDESGIEEDVGENNGDVEDAEYYK